MAAAVGLAPDLEAGPLAILHGKRVDETLGWVPA
jgi:hypothetical protein